MTQIIAKITEDDGTEQSFGPVTVTAKDAATVSGVLADLEDARQKRLQDEALAAAQADQEERNRIAAEANQARIDLAASGVDPDLNPTPVPPVPVKPKKGR